MQKRTIEIERSSREAFEVSCLERPPLLADRLCEIGKLRIRDACRRKPDSRGFKGLTDLKRFEHLGKIELDHEDASARPDIDDPFGLQARDGHPYRCAA